MKISYTTVDDGGYYVSYTIWVHWLGIPFKTLRHNKTKEALILRTTLAFLEGGNREQ